MKGTFLQFSAFLFPWVKRGNTRGGVFPPPSSAGITSLVRKGLKSHVMSCDHRLRPPGDVGEVVEEWLEVREVASLLECPPRPGGQVRLVEDGALVERGEQVQRHRLAVQNLSLQQKVGREK